jgi:hypothetical protein
MSADFNSNGKVGLGNGTDPNTRDLLDIGVWRQHIRENTVTNPSNGGISANNL